MSYIVKVARGSPEFDPLVKIISMVRQDNKSSTTEEDSVMGGKDIRKIILKEYGIDIGEYSTVERYTPVDFGDDQNYVWFLLRWT